MEPKLLATNPVTFNALHPLTLTVNDQLLQVIKDRLDVHTSNALADWLLCIETITGFSFASITLNVGNLKINISVLENLMLMISLTLNGDGVPVIITIDHKTFCNYMAAF
jgi:hypothetical protein